MSVLGWSRSEHAIGTSDADAVSNASMSSALPIHERGWIRRRARRSRRGRAQRRGGGRGARPHGSRAVCGGAAALTRCKGNFRRKLSRGRTCTSRRRHSAAAALAVGGGLWIAASSLSASSQRRARGYEPIAALR